MMAGGVEMCIACNWFPEGFCSWPCTLLTYQEDTQELFRSLELFPGKQGTQTRHMATPII